MKRNGLKRGFSGLLAVVMTVTMLLGLGIGEALFAAAEEPVGGEIIWDFEDGELAPFELVSGSYGTIISNIPWQHNEPATAYPRQGNYHLSTLETKNYYVAGEAGIAGCPDPTKMTKPTDEYMCELHSPMFRLDDPKINFLVGGGAGDNDGTYVALCDSYGREIITASGNDSEAMVCVQWDLTDEELVGQYVFLKIVDGSTGGWGHITFDDFHAVGYIDGQAEVQEVPPTQIVWSFETGGLTPFRIKSGTFGEGLIANWIYERNAPFGQINKDGNYYLSTVETDTTVNFNEAYTGVIVSPSFRIKDPIVTMKLGGGAGRPDELYVAIVRDSDNKQLVKYNLAVLPSYQFDANGDCVIDLEEEVFSTGHMMENVTLMIPKKDYVEGESVHIEIVDAATTGPWGFIMVDDIRAKGDIIGFVETAKPSDTPYEDIKWSFEDGTIAPLTIHPSSTATINPALITKAAYELNTGVGDIGKDGTYWINTYGTTEVKQTIENGVVTGKEVNGREDYTGALVSPTFYLDPEDTQITLHLGGNAKNVAVVYDQSQNNAIVGEAHSEGTGWVMKKVSVVWKDGYTYTEGTPLFMEIHDNTKNESNGYNFFCLDNIEFHGTLTPQTSSSYYDVAWDFETGTMAPFTTEETWPGGLINSIAIDYNTRNNPAAQQVPNNKQGTYFLNTVLKAPDGISGSYDETPTGALKSPAFVLNPEDTEISLKLGGGNASGVVVYDAQTNQKVGEVVLTAAQQGWVFQDVKIQWVEGFQYAEGQKLYLQIEDRATSSWGFVSVDNIRFNGKVDGETGSGSGSDSGATSGNRETRWGFEDGTIAPFTTEDYWDDVKPFLISNRTVSNNDASLSLRKEGTYFLQTVMTHATANQYNEAVTGTFVSPVVMLDAASPIVQVKLGGGPGNYFSVINANNGEVLGRAEAGTKASGDRWPFVDYTIDLTGKYIAGTPVYFEISDNTTQNWAFITVDDIRFVGQEVTYDYRDTIWSFENETIQPFYTSSVPNDGIIATYRKATHGKFYLNTVLTAPGNERVIDEAWTGTFISPKFMLDPDKPTISMCLNGGNSNCYAAVYNAASGKELGRAIKTTSGWGFENITIDLTGKITGMEKLVLKIVDDNSGSGFAWLGVDNIRGSFYFPEAVMLTTLKQIQAATGCDSAMWDAAIKTVQENMEKYTAEEYPKGEEFLERIAMLQARQAQFAATGIKDDAPELDELTADIKALIEEIKTSTPALSGGLMLVTAHHQYNHDHHNTHNMFPAYPGEISDKAYYSPGGAVRLVDLNTGEVTTLLEDADGVYRDLELSYDAKKVLLSYRKSRNSTYNIVEYDLGVNLVTGKYELTNPRELTCLPTADDMDPLYLPSGQIVFGSTRDPKYVMCNRHIGCNLYRMEADGANIVKITSSTLFEHPTDILPDGRILYDRWEYNDRDFGSAQALWTVYPDGTKQDTYYGNNSPTGVVIEAKAIPGTTKVAAILSSCHDRPWGAVAIIDRSKGVDGRDPIVYTWPQNVKNGIANNGAGNNIDAFVGLGVKYEDPQPLDENHILASRGNTIVMLDTNGGETQIYQDAQYSVWDATILAPREKEIAISDRRDYTDNTGSFFVQDVYEGTHMQGIERGTVKTLRIVESMDKKYISQSQQWGGEGQQNPGVNWHSFEVKRVIGEVPVYEDGSAYFEVPQDVFVYFQLLDESGRMIQSMRSGTLVQSGEKTGCIGCHEDRRIAPMTYTDEETPMALKANVEVIPNPKYTEGSDLPKTVAVNTPDKPQKRVLDFATGKDKLVDWDNPELFPEYTDLPTMNFLTEVQPVFTNNCLECHGYDKTEANLALVPDKDVIFNAAYINLWVNRGKSGVHFNNLVGAIGGGNNTFYPAKAWGSYNSPLIKKIYEADSHKNILTEAEKRRVAEWVDLNGTYYGDYSSNYSTNPGGRSPLTDGERGSIGDGRGLGWSSLWGSTIYFDNPEKSPILKGKSGGGYDYALQVITTGRDRLRMNPDVDWKGLTTVPGNPSLSVNPYKQCAMDAWRTEKVALYDAMEAANRAAVVAGRKVYDSDYEAAFAEHNTKWPGWPTGNGSDWYYHEILN